MHGAAGQPAAVPISTPYSSWEGSASRARRTSWVRMVMRGVRCCSMLVVYLEARLITSYSSGATPPDHGQAGSNDDGLSSGRGHNPQAEAEPARQRLDIQDDESFGLQPGRRAMRRTGHEPSMPAFRSVVSALVSFVGRSFSYELKAARGRPPAAAVLGRTARAPEPSWSHRPPWPAARAAPVQTDRSSNPRP